MSTVTMQTDETPPNEGQAPVADVIEAVAELLENAQPETSDNDVAVAAIQADAEIQIAQTQADARIEESRNAQWTMEDLRSVIRQEMTEALSLYPPHFSPPMTAPVVEAIAEATADQLSETQMAMLGTDQSIAPTEQETPMEAGDASADWVPDLPPLVEVKDGPVIKLV